jgi:prepilin-type N-terminal cleavage/methylation domain-containing protein
MRPQPMSQRHDSGMTLVELMVVAGILATVLLILTSILLSSSRVQSRTVRRAEVQADCRQTVSLISSEIRQAGADPRNPPMGVIAIVSADSISIHTRADLNGNGAIETTEPSEDVTYRFNPGTRVITRDPGTGPVALLANVTSMSLSYFDAANLPVTPLPLSAVDAARVRSVGMTITSLDRDSQPLTLRTRITLRNL